MPRMAVTRTASVVGAGLKVVDAILLEGRFAPGKPLRLGLPSGMRLLGAEAGSDARVAATSATLTLYPYKKSARLEVRADFAADLADGINTGDFLE